MALLIKTDGTAVVEEPKGATAAAGAVADSGETVKDTTTTTTKTTKAEVPEAATAGMDYKTVKQNLSATYDSKYDDQLADLYNQITQRKPFTYSTDDDMLYQQYLQKYTQQGKQAMKDTLGQTAALTGGYGNSYGQVAGQQTYDAYLQQANDMIPELYKLAYGKYQDEGDRLAQHYGMLNDIEDKDFSRWMTNYQLNADNYDRLMEQAALAGAAGDFSAYKDILGEESANKMQQLFNAQTLMPLYSSGYISAEDYKTMTGDYPVGYNPNPASSSGGGGVDYYSGGSYNGGDGNNKVSSLAQARRDYYNGVISGAEYQQAQIDFVSGKG